MNLRRILPILLGFAASATPSLIAHVSVIHLRCEYRANPEGIGELHPRLGWILEAEAGARGVRQSAYQIMVASSLELLARDTGDLWDPGKVNSDRMQQIAYAGRPLTARQRCWWKLRVWDGTGAPSEWSEPAHWSVGLLAEDDWSAQWIGLDASPPTDGSTIDNGTRERLAKQPWVYADLPPSRTAPLTAYLRGTFTLAARRKLARATFALTADQVGIITVNARPAGTVTRWEQIAPADVTSLLAPGENVVGLELTQRDGYQPAALGEVRLEFEDGEPQIVAVDARWKFAVAPPAHWNERGFDDHDWKPLVAPPGKRNPWDGPPQTFTCWLAPAPLLRKSFPVTKPVRQATVYSTALGVYELQLNGARVGRDYFTPGWTDFRARVQYQTYDVTAQMCRGENVLGATLGDGWYASVLGYTGQRYYYGGYPRLRVQLEIEYADGTGAIVGSDGTWRAAPGAIRHADLMQGCEIDARRQPVGWARAGFDDSSWQPVATGLRALDPRHPPSEFVVEAANAEPTRISEELPAHTITESRPGAYTIDFGQNMVGWVRLKVSGRAGQKVMVRHGEMLNPNGTLYTSNLRGANATDVYYLHGEGTETLEPCFTFHGFRYAEVTGLESKPGLDAVTGVVVHSDLERTGAFECSSPLVNQLFQNIVWGQKGNYLEVPTDCPQRDERAGWSGDAQFFIRTAAYNFDIASFFTRWLTTLAVDARLPDGSFANVAPAFGRLWTATGWSDATLLCTHALYRVYGDTRIIERHFEAMDRYMAWLGSEPATGAAPRRRLGDHLNLGGGATVEVIDSAYCAYLSGLMAEMAAAIGRPADAARYAQLYSTRKAEFQRAFVLPDGAIRESSQTGYALAFSMDLLTDESKPKAAARFVEELQKRDWHLGTGFVGTPRLLPALHFAGRDDAAYRLLLQETYPSWLFQVKNGATTVWERWDGWTPEAGFQTVAMNSFNHYSFGSVAEYLYRYLAGIDADSPGFRSLVIQPSVVAGLTWARASYDSVSGRISSAWRIDGQHFRLDAEVPPNTQATILVPATSPEAVQESEQPATQSRGVSLLRFDSGRAVFRVGSGAYHFSSVVPVNAR
jgi:alpha-L-rhamnosidase